MQLHCPACDRMHPHDPWCYACPHCGSALEVLYDADQLERGGQFAGRGVWRYRDLLPVDMAVTLYEGDTGLHLCTRLGNELGIPRLYVKNEGENPTGSFKDRGMTVGMSLAVVLGVRSVVCASTGNTSASMSAYAARAGLKPIVLVPAGKVAAGKLAQTLAHDALLVEIDGNFDDAMRLVIELSKTERSAYLLNSANPYRLEGQKTLAFEVVESLGKAPDAIVLPMGNAGNISAIWKGLKELAFLGRVGHLPRMVGVQAVGAAPIVHALNLADSECRVANPETIATAIRIGSPVNAFKALAALRESNGEAGTVTDEQILAAQRDLARLEGLFVEPASAAPIAYLRAHPLKDAQTVVCVATGHGLKDPDAVASAPVRRAKIRPDLDELKKLVAT